MKAVSWADALSIIRRTRDAPCLRVLLVVLIVSACSRSTDGSPPPTVGKSELTVRPILKVLPADCGTSGAPPGTPEATGHYQLNIPAEGSGDQGRALCVQVGAASLRTDDFASALIDAETSVIRNGAQVEWRVVLTLTDNGAVRASTLTDACIRATPQCPGSLGAGGHVILAFGDSAISMPIDAADPTIFRDRRMGVGVSSEDQALALVRRISPAFTAGSPEDDGNAE